MENNLTIFNFENSPIRTINIDNDVWFVGKDVCDILGYTNDSKALNDHCKGVTKYYPLQTAGGKQNIRIISEGDLNRLILHSEMPKAKEFEKQVMEKILPTIRKTGKYESRTFKAKNPDDNLVADFAEDRLKLAKMFGLEGNQALLSVNRTLIQEKNYDAIKALGIELLSDVKAKTYTPTELGARINLKAVAFNQLLESKGLQVKRVHGKHTEWEPTQLGKPYCEVSDVGKKHSTGAPVKQIKWYESVLDVVK